jgi:hypothetical protein
MKEENFLEELNQKAHKLYKEGKHDESIKVFLQQFGFY